MDSKSKIADQLLKRQRALRGAKVQKWRRRMAAGRGIKGGGGDGGTPLTVTLNRAVGQSALANTSPINFTATFSADVTGFTSADIVYTGSTVGGTPAATITGTNPYNVAIAGMTTPGNVQVRIPAASVLDASTGLISNSSSGTALVAYDAVQPSVTINKASGQDDPTSSASISFTVVFSKAVTGFTAADVSFTGSTVTGTLAAAITGSGTTYNVLVTGATAAGNVVATIPAGGAADTFGNTNTVSSSTDNTVAYDPDLEPSAFPDSTNTGFRNAPGYPGSLTTGPSTIVSDTTYQFMSFGGGTFMGEAGALSNVTFFGCRFHASATGIAAAALWGDNFIFDYCSFEPTDASPPPVSNSRGYQYGIAANGGFGGGGSNVQKLTITHCDIWGFANAIDTRGSTAAKPHVFEHNWIHDCRDPINPAISGPVDDDHTDGIGSFGVDDHSEYVVINHNTIKSPGNTNAIGYQFSDPANHGGTGFNHITITNNLISGWNNAMNFGGVFPDSANSTASHITFTGNTFSTEILITNGINHQEWYNTTGSTWSNNRWLVPSGAAWGTPAHDGFFWIPSTAATSGSTDFPYVSDTDYLATYTPPVGGVTDDFNRANGAIGSNWGTDRGSVVIVSNAAKASAAGVNSVAFRTAEDFTANQYSEIVWQGTVVSGGAAPIVRHNGSNPGSYYAAFFDGSRMYLQRVAAGSYTDIDNVLFEPVAGNVLRLDATGSTLTVTRNGAIMYTTTDTTLTTGRPGVEFYDTSAAISDWSGGPESASDWSAVDGTIGAPTGTPQYPDLLDDYTARPLWSVAGVDYRVGINTGVTLLNPSTISMTGVSVNGTTHEVTITGAGVTLDGYDFSLANGWGIIVDAANFTVTNSKFIVGSNNLVPIDGTNNGTNIHISYCTFDGQDNNPGTGALINSDAGDLTIEYCQIENSGGDLIQWSPTSGDLLLRWSILGDAGMAIGSHGDYIQSVSDTGPITFTTKFCLGLQDRVVVATQGFMAEPSGADIAGVELGNCTLVALGTDVLTYWIGITCPDLSGAASVHDNYIDNTGAFGLAPGGAIRGGPDDAFVLTTYTGNIDMVTGLAVSNDTVASAPSDNFNRADGGLGANWGTDTTAIAIVSNQAKASSGTNCRAFRSAETFAANHYSQVVWQGGLNNGGGPLVRHNGASPGAYYLGFCNAATDQMMISRADSGSYATLASASQVIANGDVIKLEAVGSTLNLYLNGVLKVTTTHTDFTTGRPGFEIYNTDIALDDWEGGDV